MRRASMLFGAVLLAAAIAAGSALAATSVGTTKLVAGGSATLAVSSGTAVASGTLSSEIPGLEVDADVPNTGMSAARVPSAGVPQTSGNAVVGKGSELLKGFEGLNHADQRFSGT